MTINFFGRLKRKTGLSKKHSMKTATNIVKKTNRRMSKKKRIVLEITILVIFLVASVFAVMKYIDYQDNRIYAVGQEMDFGDFRFIVTGYEFKKPDLPLDTGYLERAGISKDQVYSKEDCSLLSDEEPAVSTDHQLMLGRKEPSPRASCENMNNEKDILIDYCNANRQIVVHYNIKAIKNVKSKNISLKLVVDSGRKLNSSVGSINDDWFIAVGTNYVPYYMSNIGDDINSKISRDGFAFTDVRTSERSVDFVVSYRTKNIINKFTRINL